MSYFALLWKARAIEKYRLKYEKEKINSIMMSNTEMPKTALFQKWSVYRYDAQQRLSTTFKKLYPKGSGISNFFIYLKTDQTFPNFVLKSILGFAGGIILTYLCFMFFVFQLSISLILATIMSSIIGVLLTLGLAFSYRIRCLVFLLIPQFFSRVGRYTITCYALVLILTGPATNTLKNSEVLSESMACSQEQIKTSVHQIRNSMEKPLNAAKDSLKLIIEKMNKVAMRVKKMLISLNRLVMSIVHIIQSSFSWLESTAKISNKILGTPYEHCTDVLKDGIANCKNILGPKYPNLYSVDNVAFFACEIVKPYKSFYSIFDYADGAITATMKKKLKNFNERIRAMLYVDVHIHHSYSFSSNASRSASQVAAGIVTEIRNRADPLLTWLSWSSCVTSLFLLLIIFRAKYYQHMYETRSRFDNRFVTRELRELDLDRQRQDRDTVLPLNRRERAKYITTTSFRLVSTEKVHLNRSAVFMVITTFKLLIHMIADYSLYWVLTTIRYHGRFQSNLSTGVKDAGVQISGSGFAADMLRSLIGSLNIPLMSPMSYPINCLPDPYPPDFRRYSHIGILIILLWFFALFEPYGLRLRHMIMGRYRPERAKTRAIWLFNHILRTRGSFMKFARRKLHREYKYCSEAKYTFRRWLQKVIFCQWLQYLLGIKPEGPICLLCGTIEKLKELDTQLIRCETPNCPGIFCSSCFTDIGQLCTICLSPADYGDQSDCSLEKGSSDDNDSDDDSRDSGTGDKFNFRKKDSWREADDSEQNKDIVRKSKFSFITMKSANIEENIPLLKRTQNITQNSYNYNAIQTKSKKVTSKPACYNTRNKTNLKKGSKNVSGCNGGSKVTQVNVERTNKQEDIKNVYQVTWNNQGLKIYKTKIEKNTLRNFLLPQSLLRQLKLLFTYSRRKSFIARSDSKIKIIKDTKPSNEDYISNSIPNSRRLHKLILQFNVFNKSVKVNAYKILRQPKKSKKMRRRKYYRQFELGIKRSNSSRITKQVIANLAVNNDNIKRVTHGDNDNKGTNTKNLDIMKGECSRKIRPTETGTGKPEANQKNNKYIDKATQDEKDKVDSTEKSYSCTDLLHILCFKYWKRYGLKMIPCTDFMSDRRSLILSNENKNFKHRKKDKEFLIAPLVTSPKNKKRIEVEDERNYRIESFLDQQQWINNVYKQEIGHGDRKKDDNAANEIHLKEYPNNCKLERNTNVVCCKGTMEKYVNTSGDKTCLKEKNASESHSQTKEVIPRSRKKVFMISKETSPKSCPSVPNLETIVGAVKTSVNKDLSSLVLQCSTDYNVSSCQTISKPLGSTDERKTWQFVVKTRSSREKVARTSAVQKKTIGQNYCYRVFQDTFMTLVLDSKNI